MRMRKKKHGEERLAACSTLLCERPEAPITEPSEFFDRKTDVYLEIGCGKGDFADLAIVESITLDSEIYAVGFKKGSELTAKVNAAIKELAADGTLAALAEKYGLSNYVITNFD